MATPYPYKIFACGDHAVTIDFGNIINEGINDFILQLFNRAKQKSIYGIKDIIPAYSSITLVYDIMLVRSVSGDKSAYDFIKQAAEELLNDNEPQEYAANRIMKIPACYEDAFAPDLRQVAFEKKLSVEEIINIHTSKTYRVFMLGFLPGFAYMGIVDDSISIPRRPAPRINVTAGSIGIAGLQTGIYPLDSPGGWNIIATTPMRLFNAAKSPPVVLQAGDNVRFYAVTGKEFKQIKSVQ